MGRDVPSFEREPQGEGFCWYWGLEGFLGHLQELLMGLRELPTPSLLAFYLQVATGLATGSNDLRGTDTGVRSLGSPARYSDPEAGQGKTQGASGAVGLLCS